MGERGGSRAGGKCNGVVQADHEIRRQISRQFDKDSEDKNILELLADIEGWDDGEIDIQCVYQ